LAIFTVHGLCDSDVEDIHRDTDFEVKNGWFEPLAACVAKSDMVTGRESGVIDEKERLLIKKVKRRWCAGVARVGRVD